MRAKCAIAPTSIKTGLARFMDFQNEIGIVLTDMVMPKKSGRELYESMRMIRPDIKAVFMSGYPADLIEQKGILYEHADYLPKPIAPDALLRKIRAMLDNGKHERSRS